MTGTDISIVFAALADPTRLALIETLSDGESRSIVVLSQNGSITRQAVTKHLSVLEQARLVEREKVGRESRFRLQAAPLIDARAYLATVSSQWDNALQRLRRFVED
ncbi:metalloregulator ArsR/SmtB family transcription factor [Ochrobactrum vermis]|uniref:Metalloregulator ArsR/SmtB family transcription factor n=1 Tax=Ochrobactrum vermis TaxID=1827297 RepID=A0ABU8PBV7_9HYPH|nr:metalloregulator ArsR/SmtB family transcription factor [Ochrobactrum vermis]PQZ29466.1 transcriptional regulator [Ochrobactrum vermis]